MSRELFGKVIEFEGRQFRYNEEEAVLEWLSYYEWDDKELDLIKRDYLVVADSIGLTVENAEADLMGYIAIWREDMRQELSQW